MIFFFVEITLKLILKTKDICKIRPIKRNALFYFMLFQLSPQENAVLTNLRMFYVVFMAFIELCFNLWFPTTSHPSLSNCQCSKVFINICDRVMDWSITVPASFLS